jgi:hypothetical protein
MAKARCCDCQYFVPDNMKKHSHPSWGSCHRHAPVPCMRNENDSFSKHTNWPAVWSSDWCGQFKPCPDCKACNACFRKAAS